MQCLLLTNYIMQNYELCDLVKNFVFIDKVAFEFIQVILLDSGSILVLSRSKMLKIFRL